MKATRRYRTARDREAAEAFPWADVSVETEKIELIASAARALTGRVKKTASKEHHAKICRASLELMRLCRLCDQPPPQELSDLVAALTGCDGPPRNQVRIKGQLEAAKFLAANPGASNRAVARAIGADHKTVGKWKHDPKFLEGVRAYTIIQAKTAKIN